MIDARSLRLLGLGARAGSVVKGTGAVRAALQRGTARLVVVARDRSARTVEKVVRLAAAKGVPTVVGPEAIELGRVLGSAALQAAAVCDVNLAAGIEAGRNGEGSQEGISGQHADP